MSARCGECNGQSRLTGFNSAICLSAAQSPIAYIRGSGRVRRIQHRVAHAYIAGECRATHARSRRHVWRESTAIVISRSRRARASRRQDWCNNLTIDAAFPMAGPTRDSQARTRYPQISRPDLAGPVSNGVGRPPSRARGARGTDLILMNERFARRTLTADSSPHPGRKEGRVRRHASQAARSGADLVLSDAA